MPNGNISNDSIFAARLFMLFYISLSPVGKRAFNNYSACGGISTIFILCSVWRINFEDFFFLESKESVPQGHAPRQLRSTERTRSPKQHKRTTHNTSTLISGTISTPRNLASPPLLIYTHHRNNSNSCRIASCFGVRVSITQPSSWNIWTLKSSTNTAKQHREGGRVR